jgi:hypothetical protein
MLKIEISCGINEWAVSFKDNYYRVGVCNLSALYIIDYIRRRHSHIPGKRFMDFHLEEFGDILLLRFISGQEASPVA